MIFKRVVLLNCFKLSKSNFRLLHQLTTDNKSSQLLNESDNLLENFYSSNPDAFSIINESFHIVDNFITIDEEANLMEEVDRYLDKRRYESNHWDDAISLFRELQRANWTKKNLNVIEKVRETCFPENHKLLRNVHILDLHEDGHIKPHVDSVRFCGPIIAGLSLLSDSVMRLSHTKDESLALDLLLKRRSLYVMKGVARYDFKHEILGKNVSFFKQQPVLRKRRVSLINRCEPID